MRYYLDTNILIYMLRRERDELSVDVWATLSNDVNMLLTSTVCIHELIHLNQIGKVPFRRNGKVADIKDFADWLDDIGVRIIPVTIHHLRQLAQLPLYPDHRDPNDRLIVAQAISDHIPLVSSDSKMGRYGSSGLEFVCNRR